MSDLRMDPSDRPTAQRRPAKNTTAASRQSTEALGDSQTLSKAHVQANRRQKPPKDSKPLRKRRSWLKRFFIWSLTVAVWGFLALAGLLAFYARDLPDLDIMTASNRRPSITFLSTDGEVVAAYGDIYGEPLEIKDLPPSLIAAVLSTEDRRFYSHFGVDILGIARAMVRNIKAGRMVQGGSGITQQLAKNLFLTPDRTFKRKIHELLIAFWLEHRFTKDQILTLYLNRVYLGAGTYGVDAAARRYFEKSARDLTVYEAALLAGLLKGPSYYNPFVNVERSRTRTRQVVFNMVDSGAMTAADAQIVLDAPPPKISHTVLPGRYFADWVYEQVESYAGQTSEDLVIRTTLTMSIQREAEKYLEKMLAESGESSGVQQGAIVLMTPTGAVRAMVGGRRYADSQFNRVTQAKRQPGSTFKPFVYLAALESGMTPDSLIDDAAITEGKWRPKNYVNRYDGPMPLREALTRSINTVVVRLIFTVTPQNVVQLVRRLGITSPLKPEASLALGTNEVSLLELTGAYATLANGGQGVFPYGIAEIQTKNGRLLYRREGSGGGPVVAAEPLHDLVSMMVDVLENTRGTGKRARLTGYQAAGKTGTTQDYKDAWFTGFTADLVGGVWLGNDDGTPMKKVTGGGLPADLWKQVMTAGLKGIPPRPIPILAAGSAGVVASNAPTSLLPPSAETPPQTHDGMQGTHPTLAPEEQAQWESLIQSLADE